MPSPPHSASKPDPSEVSTGSLVRLVREGDVAAFEQLYRRHSPRIYPMLWRLSGGDTGRAEDWLQDSFHRVWQKIGELRDPERFGPWLKRLSLNTALADRRRPGLQLVDGSTHPTPDLEPPWPAADLDLEREVARLPLRARTVLVLFCLEGFSHAEIAEQMETDIGTSKAQLHRARQLLKERLA